MNRTPALDSDYSTLDLPTLRPVFSPLAGSYQIEGFNKT